MLKIACIGAHGTGKTTLMSLLEARLLLEGHTVTRVSSVTRDLKNLGIDFSETNNDLSQILSFSAHYIRLKHFASEFDFLLSDRSVFDDLAYIRTDSRFDRDLGDRLTRWIFSSFSDFWDIVFYLPIKTEIEDDDVRSVKRSYQYAVDYQVQQLVEELKTSRTRIKTIEQVGFNLELQEMIDYIEGYSGTVKL